jgi:hypothetical protein
MIKQNSADLKLPQFRELHQEVGTAAWKESKYQWPVAGLN